MATAVVAMAIAVGLSGCGGTSHPRLPPSFSVESLEMPVREQYTDSWEYNADIGLWDQGHFTVGGYLFYINSLLSDVASYFGAPATKKAVDSACIVQWPTFGLAVEVAYDITGGPPCSSGGGSALVALTDPRWHTERGLRVGDSIARLRRVYPEAKRHSWGWELEHGPGYSADEPPTTSIVWLAAYTKRSHITRIVLSANGLASADAWPDRPAPSQAAAA